MKNEKNVRRGFMAENDYDDVALLDLSKKMYGFFLECIYAGGLSNIKKTVLKNVG